jgi:hypothetical protein
MSVALSGVLPAAVIIGNLSGNSPSVHSFDSASTMSLGGTIGASNVTLTSANLRLQAQDLSGEAGLLIYSDDSGDPGTTLLADLGTQTVSGVSFSDYFFAPATQPLLLANSKYWLTITTTITSTSTITSLLHPNALLVAADSTLSPPSGSFATFLGLRFDDGNSITNLDSSQIPSFQVNGVVGSAAVSEPANLLFIILAGGAMFLIRMATQSEFWSGTKSVA